MDERWTKHFCSPIDGHWNPVVYYKSGMYKDCRYHYCYDECEEEKEFEFMRDQLRRKARNWVLLETDALSD